MSSLRSSNKRSFLKSQYQIPFDEDDETPSIDTQTHYTEDVDNEINNEQQTTKALLPPREKVEGRHYVAKAKGRIADYWEYLENGKRRAECHCHQEGVNQKWHAYYCRVARE
ncbi:hypothetical protein K7X08_002975 [Anisodus acutangulus]|uniref:Uncharacterized protein n=1 Tax=Anisodus acutangulus TaxID=402998 RepID=A0A9Q1MDB5_9SOLA|nr:hypothetical protein K7X08_002975 [Anisodus acutangulus]